MFFLLIKSFSFSFSHAISYQCILLSSAPPPFTQLLIVHISLLSLRYEQTCHINFTLGILQPKLTSLHSKTTYQSFSLDEIHRNRMLNFILVFKYLICTEYMNINTFLLHRYILFSISGDKWIESGILIGLLYLQ